MDVDVIIVGAGPTGLMLGGELRLGGVRPLVLERQPRLRETPKANGFSGQILELLRYRGLLDRLEAASSDRSHPAPGFPFGGVQVDLSDLADPPLRVLGLPQPRLEQLLDEHVRDLGAEIRRGHEVVGVSQDDVRVTVDVRGAPVGRIGWPPATSSGVTVGAAASVTAPASRSPVRLIRRSTGSAKSPCPTR